MLQDGLQEGPALMAGGLLIEHAGLDDLLVNIQFVLSSSQNFLLHTVDGAKTKHTHFVLLTNTMSSVLSLQVLEEDYERDGEIVKMQNPLSLL